MFPVRKTQSQGLRSRTDSYNTGYLALRLSPRAMGPFKTRLGNASPKRSGSIGGLAVRGAVSHLHEQRAPGIANRAHGPFVRTRIWEGGMLFQAKTDIYASALHSNMPEIRPFLSWCGALAFVCWQVQAEPVSAQPEAKQKHSF